MFGLNKENKDDKKQQKLEQLYTKASGLSRQPGETFEQFEARVKMKDIEIGEKTKENLNGAQQMYQYCLDHNYGEGMNQKWGVKHFLLIQQALQEDEEVLMCFIGLHNYISPSKHDNNFAYAVTNKRIIMAQQKAVGQVFQTVDIDNLNDVTMSTGMLMGVITIDTIKEKFNVAVNKQAAQSINKAIHDILFSLKQQKKAPTITSQSVSSADELLKFKNLLDIGIITQEEFEQKKKQLLGL